MHSTFVEVNLSNLKFNIKQLKKLIGPKVKFMAVVKADAYGHGATEVSRAAIDAGADHLSVANIYEAITLRKAGINAPLLILSETGKENVSDIIKYDLIQTVYTDELARALSLEAKKQNKTAKIHFKIDTGMGRVGATKNAVELLKDISKLDNIRIEGVFTHLARAEEPNGFTKTQIDKFLDLVSKANIDVPIKHAANSAGTLYHKFSHLDMVRVGLSMYGLFPPGGKKDTVDLKPVLQFKTKVVYSKRVPKGTPISYGSTYITDKETNIITLPVGYADGFSRKLSNKGKVLIKGREFPIVGRICMDLTMVNVGDENIDRGEEVILIGRQNGMQISADDVASMEDTINYEVVCRIGKRVPRVYVK